MGKGKDGERMGKEWEREEEELNFWNIQRLSVSVCVCVCNSSKLLSSCEL